jgi:hypothetical protein
MRLPSEATKRSSGSCWLALVMAAVCCYFKPFLCLRRTERLSPVTRLFFGWPSMTTSAYWFRGTLTRMGGEVSSALEAAA